MTLTAKDLSFTEGVLTARPEDSLASALGKIHSSHDAVFVSQKNTLMGVISPYHVLYRSHFPGATKVKNCLFLAPKLKPDTKIDQIARLMLEAKVYFLPVVTESGKWLGVVSYRRLLRQLNGFKVSPKPLVTIKDNLTVSQARNLMKSSGVSRLIVTIGNDRLAGILTRYDLRKSLNLPPAAPIKAYIKHDVATFRPTDNPVNVINQMVDRRIGSMVMINQNYQPIGLLSVRDCLEALAHSIPAPLKQELSVKLTKVRSGFEALVRRGQTAAHAVGKFKKQTLRKAFDRLNRQLIRE